MRKIDIYDKTFYVTIVIVTVVVAALFINSEKGSFAEPKEPKEPNETQAIAGLGYTDTIKTMPIIEQVHQFGWGKIPKQNNCPHCGKLSFTRFCTKCGKERGDLPFIGVYCPKCNPDGNYASQTSDVTEICGDCGSRRTWKYVYEDWQTEPNELNEPMPSIVDDGVCIRGDPNEPDCKSCHVDYQILEKEAE